MSKYLAISYSSENEGILETISKLKVNKQYLLDLLYKTFPIIAQNLSVDKRLELLPLNLLLAVFEQEDMLQQAHGSSNSNQECKILKVLFNLIEKPNPEQRAMILNSCIQFTKHVGPMYVNNYLLPLCWEQLSDKSEEKRMLIAEACSTLSPYIYNDIRNSLMFSILKQIIEQENSEAVRICTVKSLSILTNHLKDEQKFTQVK